MWAWRCHGWMRMLRVKNQAFRVAVGVGAVVLVGGEDQQWGRREASGIDRKKKLGLFGESVKELRKPLRLGSSGASRRVPRVLTVKEHKHLVLVAGRGNWFAAVSVPGGNCYLGGSR